MTSSRYKQKYEELTKDEKDKVTALFDDALSEMDETLAEAGAPYLDPVSIKDWFEADPDSFEFLIKREAFLGMIPEKDRLLSIYSEEQIKVLIDLLNEDMISAPALSEYDGHE